MACALAPNWPALIVFRLLCGISASAPLVVVPGIYADIYNDPAPRGRAMVLFMGVSEDTSLPFNRLLTTHIRPLLWAR